MDLGNLPIIDWQLAIKLAGNQTDLANELLNLLIKNLRQDVTTIHQLYEEKKYTEAIELAKAILIQSPNNLTGHKEIGYAYKHIGNTDLANKHFRMMVKIIKSILKYSNGSLKNPYILNNFFEGKSLYEADFGCFPDTSLVLTTDKRLLGTYKCFHINTLADLTHWLPLLKKGDYYIEK